MKEVSLAPVCVCVSVCGGEMIGEGIYTLGALSPEESKRPGRRTGQQCSVSWSIRDQKTSLWHLGH